jgi:hypothetical protein
MGWNNKSALPFVELHKAKPVRWDPTHPKYYNKHTKHDASEELAKAAGSRIIWPIASFENLKRYCRLVYESPAAINRSVSLQLEQLLFMWYPSSQFSDRLN